MRLASLRLCSLLLALTAGCAPRLVFVNPGEGVRPELIAGPAQCEVPASKGRERDPEPFLQAGDQLRNKLLSFEFALPHPAPSLPLEEGLVKGEVARRREAVRGVVQQAYRTWKHASACYERALELDPGRSYALLGLAVINIRMYDLMGDETEREQYFTRAQEHLARADEANKSDAQALYYQAELKVRKEMWAEAQALLVKLHDHAPTRANVLALLGWVHAHRGESAKALEVWNKAARVDRPVESNAWAIQKTRTPTRATRDANLKPARNPMLWDRTRGEIVPAIAPPLPEPCIWMENGRTQC